MRVLLILPAYNEESTIESTVRKIEEFAPIPGVELDYIVINDGSTDSTAQLCREKNIKCLSLVQNLGIGGAVQSGYLYAKENCYDVAVQFDGDGQHDINSLPQLLAPIQNDTADFVVGSRFLLDENGNSASGFQSTALRRLGIRYLSAVIRLVTGKRIKDVTSGYRAANRKALCFLAENYPVDYPEPEALVHLFKQKLRVCEQPVNMLERTGGKSSIHSFKSLYYMIKVTLAVLCAALQKGVK